MWLNWGFICNLVNCLSTCVRWQRWEEAFRLFTQEEVPVVIIIKYYNAKINQIKVLILEWLGLCEWFIIYYWIRSTVSVYKCLCVSLTEWSVSRGPLRSTCCCRCGVVSSLWPLWLWLHFSLQSRQSQPRSVHLPWEDNKLNDWVVTQSEQFWTHMTGVFEIECHTRDLSCELVEFHFCISLDET